MRRCLQWTNRDKMDPGGPYRYSHTIDVIFSTSFLFCSSSTADPIRAHAPSIRRCVTATSFTLTPPNRRNGKKKKTNSPRARRTPAIRSRRLSRSQPLPGPGPDNVIPTRSVYNSYELPAERITRFLSFYLHKLSRARASVYGTEFLL